MAQTSKELLVLTALNAENQYELLCYRYLFLPWGLRQGLKQTEERFKSNNLLEQAYMKSQQSLLNQDQVTELANQLGWNHRQVRQWFVKYFSITAFFWGHGSICHYRLHQRKQQRKPSALVKLTESGWRFTYYTFSVVYGLWVLWDKPWFWNIDECWRDYPHQVNNDIIEEQSQKLSFIFFRM